MDLVVRSPHGDADISIETDMSTDAGGATATLGDVVAAVTGQAVPSIVVVDGRVLPATTPLADEHVRIGSVLSTVSVEHDQPADPVISLLQHAGRGAGTIRPLAPGRYRIGPGRRLSATELADAPVEQVAFELEVGDDALTVHPADDSPVTLGGRSIIEPTPWNDGDLLADGRVFGFARETRSVPNGRHPADADGTVPFTRTATAGVTDHRTLVDVVRAATDHDPSLWRRRLDLDTALNVPIGLVDDGGATLRRVSLTVGAGRGAALVGSEDVAEAMARAVVLGAVAAHGPADLEVVVATTPDRVGQWDWLKWVPHARLQSERSILATDTALRRWADRALSPDQRAVTLLIVDDPERWNRRTSPLREVVASPPTSIRLVVLCDRVDRVPASCRTVVEHDGRHASMTIMAPSGPAAPAPGVVDFLPSLVDQAVAAEAARSIASLVDIDGDDIGATADRPASTPVLAETIAAVTADNGLASAVWIGNSDIGDPVTVDWTVTSSVSLHGSDDGDLDALAVTLVTGLVAHVDPAELPVLLAGDHEGSSVLDLLAELPHVGGRCHIGDRFEQHRVLARVESISTTRGVCVVLAGRELDDWLPDLITLAERSPSVRAVVVRSGAIDTTPQALHDHAIDIEVTRPTGLPQATMTRGTENDEPESIRFAPVLPAAPGPSGRLALRPLVIGRPLTSLERRLARAVGPRTTVDDAIRAVLGSVGNLGAGDSTRVPVLVPPSLPSVVDLDDLLAAHEADAIPIGLADDAAHAEMPVVWWQPGERGTLLFVGSPRAELDGALWAILRGVAERCAPDDVRLAVIDSSNRRIAAASAMPHTDIVAPSDRADLTANVIAHVAAELSARRAEPNLERPRLVLLVSDLTQVTRRLADSAYSSTVGTLHAIAGGAHDGVNVVALASGIDGTSALLDVAADVYVGLLTNADEVTALGLDSYSMSVCGPGRCWSRATGLLTQLASTHRGNR